jgi:single-stranded-DNA-specific exonuclease
VSRFSATAPRLTKRALFELLQSRFEADAITRLSELQEPSVFKDMERAVERIAAAVAAKEPITLIGDYDVDGVTASVIVKEFFDALGYPLEVVIPNRFSDGYGISPKVLERVDAKLVITVDNGISGVEAADVCKARGIDLIITDHHTCPDKLPDAYAIINPKQSECGYAFKEICGATVAWYLVAALKTRLNVTIDMKQFFDLLTIATVADAVPLVSVNRVIVKHGLKVLETSRRPAILAFKEKIGKERFSSEDVGFAIAPKLNAAGRMNSAMEAYEFLRAPNGREAMRWLDYLWQLNNQRKEIESAITAQAKEMVTPESKVIVVWGEAWHEGVIGIVASRLVDAFKLPAIVLSLHGGKAKGSARSVGDVDIYSLIKAQEALLEGFGGHKQAAGLTIAKENLETFKAAVNQAASLLDPGVFTPHVNLIGTMTFGHLDAECFEIIEQFEPYGMANPRPLFLAEAVDVVNCVRVGAGQDHAKLLLRSNAELKKAMAFFCDRELCGGDRVCVAFALVKNEFRNEVNYELQIKEFLDIEAS